jgi:hypothetical protein
MMTLANALATDASEILTIRVDMAYGRYLRTTGDQTHFAQTLYTARPIAEAPQTAVDKRQHALSVFICKHVDYSVEFPEYNESMAADLDKMAALGRTARWRTAVKSLRHACKEDPNMIMQMITYANYAAL